MRGLQKTENRKRKTECGMRNTDKGITEDGRQKTEDGVRTTDEGITKDRRQKTEDGMQNTNGLHVYVSIPPTTRSLQ